MNKYIIALVLLFLPSLTFSGGFIKDVGNPIAKDVIDAIIRDNVSKILGIDVRQRGGQAITNSAQDTTSSGLQQGAVTNACGCYGNVQIGATRQNQQCASGVEATALCYGRCQGGGSPWATVCQ
jgi:hypothetical protein